MRFILGNLIKGLEAGRRPMPRLSYDSAETLVYDPISANRTATRSLLYNLGFRRIETVATLEALSECIMRRPPDLAMCEVQGAEDELCNLIQNLRQGGAGYNPFIVMIVTAWEKTNGLVARVLNSGADDLLLRPFSTAVLGQRILAHIERRKHFVITSEYVGPDRRKDSARPSNVDLFEPPNSLRLKVRDAVTTEEATQRLDHALKAAREMLTAEKLRRDAFQICILWRLLQDDLPGSGKYDFDLNKLRNSTKSIARRCVDTDMEFAIEYCESILGAVEGA